MDEMARGKRKAEAPNEDIQWVQGALDEIKTELRTDAKVAAALRVSRNAWKKWRKGDAVPVKVNYDRIRAVLQEVRERATKVAAPSFSPLAPAEPDVLGSATHAGHKNVARPELATMGVLLSAVAAGAEPTYLLELEICLWYHREDIERGEVSRTAISAAREGYFEDRGCHSWVARRWWTELRQHTDEMRAKLRRLRPGVLSDPKH